jgi:predicted permease
MMLGRLANLWRARRLDAELDEELRHHLAALEDEHRARGLSDDDARLAARRDMGGMAQAAEAYRDRRGIPLLEAVARDLRFGVRALWRTPGVSAAVVATLAIGIGANTALFSVVNGVLLKPLPYPKAGELVALGHRGGANVDDELPSAPYLYFTYRDQSRTLAAVGLWRTTTVNVTGAERPEQVPTVLVTSDVLPMLGVPPLLGRTFSEDDATPGHPGTVILSYAYWQRRFGGDASIVGRRLVLDGEAADIVGVMPARFRFLDARVDLFAPFQLDRTQVALGRYVFPSLARLKPGVTIADATADLTRLVPIAIERFPPPAGFTRRQFARRPVVPRLQPLKDAVVGGLGKMLWLLMGGLGLVLLIACANVANLLLVRTDGRRQELAIRAALGASGRRIALQLIVESLLLGLAGGAVGAGVAMAAVRVLVANAPASLPRIDDIAIDPIVLAFALVASIAAGLLFGLPPAIKYAAPRLESLGRSARGLSEGREGHRARRFLVVVQVAIALVLLVCSGLLIRTFAALGAVDPGFVRPAHVQLAHIDVGVAEAPSPEQATRLQQAILDRISAIAGVESAAFVDLPPLSGSNQNDTVLTEEDKVYAQGQPSPLRRFEFISPGLFRTLGTPILAGRDLQWVDLYQQRPVCLVSAALARDGWGSPGAALGRRVRAGPEDPWREIVGVVGDIRDNGMSQPPPPSVYFPALVGRFWGTPAIAFRSVTLAIRTARAGQESFLRELDAAIWRADPNLPIARVRTLDDAYRTSLARTSFALAMLAIAAAMGLLLGFVGIYAVVGYTVAQRTREIGIRAALGAEAGALEMMFVRDGARMTAAGVVTGLMCAAASSRLLESLLFGVSPLDFQTYAAVTALVAAAALVAAYLPARRAAHADVVNALRG